MFTNCQAEEAMTLYASVWGDDMVIEDLLRWDGSIPGGPAGKVQSALITIKGTAFRFMDSEGHPHSLTPSTSVFVECDNEAELRHAHEMLVKGGFELMELGTYPFADLYAWVQDRYGLTWQLSLSGT
jgi:predicted 3-demethylubiquinone-9 3-methyltransferase (glyoxalase superfamily)